MADKFVSLTNLRFVLNRVLDYSALCGQGMYADQDGDMLDLILETAHKLAKEKLHPLLAAMDREPPRLENGQVKVHPAMKEVMDIFGRDGWIAASAPYDLGGQQLPLTAAAAARFVFASANYSASVYPMLTFGAANLILSFGSRELIETYVPTMLSGRWTGTMALTEPQAGSSLADLAASARPTEEGHYLISGQKIFISNGDHDAAENIVHLMLARIKGAPDGVKGVSLFVVPKLRPEGDELVPNDVAVAGVFHKLGYRGAPITLLALGEENDCRAWLVGRPHQGLKYMFQMMNEARLEVGLGAAAIASAAYQASLDYARQRPQGRKPGAKDPALPQIPIIEHADVKRMLLFQKAVVEGSLSLGLQCTMYADLARISSGKDKAKYELLLDLLTPAAKTYPSEMGVLSCGAGLQILGGYGYCDEFPLEQFYRDARIHPIHEGTTGIQAMDLLGRKITMADGAALKLFIEEVMAEMEAARGTEEIAPLAADLEEALTGLIRISRTLTGSAADKGAEVYLADATLYLELFSLVAVGWQWLRQARSAADLMAEGGPGYGVDFLKGKILTARYFMAYELPKAAGLLRRLNESDPLTVEATAELFND